MPIVSLEHTGDARLQPFSGMTESQLRDGIGANSIGRPECLCGEFGLFVAESDAMIAAALDAGMRMRTLLLEESWRARYGGLVARALAACPEAFVLVATDEQFREATGYGVARGALAVFERPKPARVEDVIEDARRVAILEDVTNYANVGAAFRAAAAFGVDAVLLTPRCHDPLYRRAARVSKGSVFAVPWARFNARGAWADEGMPILRAAGFKTAALALSDRAIIPQDERLHAEPRLALVLGTEGEGLSGATIAACDYVVRIPMRDGVDSLNVAAASAVAFWELCRR